MPYVRKLEKAFLQQKKMKFFYFMNNKIDVIFSLLLKITRSTTYDCLSGYFFRIFEMNVVVFFALLLLYLT